MTGHAHIRQIAVFFKGRQLKHPVCRAALGFNDGHRPAPIKIRIQFGCKRHHAIVSINPDLKRHAINIFNSSQGAVLDSHGLVITGKDQTLPFGKSFSRLMNNRSAEIIVGFPFDCVEMLFDSHDSGFSHQAAGIFIQEMGIPVGISHHQMRLFRISFQRLLPFLHHILTGFFSQITLMKRGQGVGGFQSP